MNQLSSMALARWIVTVVALAACFALPVYDSQARSKSALLEAEPHLAKASGHLLRALALQREGEPADRIGASLPMIEFREGLPEVEIRLTELTPAIVDYLREIGFATTELHFGYARVVGRGELELLDEIAAIPEVTTIHPNFRPLSRTGSVTSQGDASIRADDARTDFGVDGTGVRVGILADSFHATGAVGGTATGAGCSRILTGSQPQSSGDLPPEVTVLDNCDSGSSNCNVLTDEGAAVGEVIHDLAPAAEILFHSAFNSEADFAGGIGELQACGADVLVDDVLWLAEPMFQDGIVAQAAQDAVDAGSSYFSAAGNEASFGVDDVYLDVDPVTDDDVFPTSGADLHDFGGGNRFAAITIPDGCGVLLVLQWNDPYSGTLGPGASHDLDLYLCSGDNLDLNENGSLFACDDNGVLAVSDDSQGCGGVEPPSGDPLEVLSYVNTTGDAVVGYMAVEHFCGSQDDIRFRIATFARNCDLTDPGYSFEGPGIFDKSSMYGHAVAAGANSVGSVFFDEIDSGGDVSTPMGLIDVEANSSSGGDLPFYFDEVGDPLPGAPVHRFKPEIVAPDGTNNTFFGQDSASDPDAFPNFFGTSAAAAHAAAVAALVLDDAPGLAPQAVRDRLTSTALDIEAIGVDALSGAGLIRAYDAVQNGPCGDPVPGEAQNLAVEMVPDSAEARLSWSVEPAAERYNLYRATRADLGDLGCFLQNVFGTTVTDDGVLPASAEAFFYLVTARNCSGESTLGSGRANPGRCP